MTDLVAERISAKNKWVGLLQSVLLKSLEASAGPGQPSIPYRSTLGGVYQSTDGGQSWTLSHPGLTHRVLRGRTIDPGDSQWSPVYTASGALLLGLPRAGNSGESLAGCIPKYPPGSCGDPDGGGGEC